MSPRPYLRDYRAGDEDRVTARADFEAEFVAEGSRLPPGPKWTVGCGPELIGVGGIERQPDGSWCAWAYMADLTPRQWVATARLARAVLALQRRLRGEILAVPADDFGAARLLDYIGFKQEFRQWTR